MKCSAILCLLIIFAGACNSKDLQAKLLDEQRLLKDSANHINDRIGYHIHKGHNDSANAEQLHLGAVYGRLIHIQSSLDSLESLKK